MIGPSLEEALDQVVTSRLQSVWTALPGRVLGDTASGFANVQPFPAIYQDGDVVELPTLHNVPVTYPGGAGGSITWELKAGDVVLLIFASAALGRYRQDGAEGDPAEQRRFDLSDAWAIPLAAGGPITATAGKVVIAAPTAPGGVVAVGGDTATQAAVLGDALLLWLNSHIHTTALGPTTPAATPATSTILSTVVKVL